MLEIKNLNFSYDNTKSILKDVNLTFKKGEVIAIQGESGQGKSTLLSILSGLESKYTGELVFESHSYTKQELRKYNKEKVCVVFQEHNLIKYLNLYDNIHQACIIKQTQFDKDKLNDYIKAFSLEDLDLAKYPQKISGGQQQRIAIIRALLTNVDIILADEPTASVDNRTTHEIISELKKLAKQDNKIVIIVTHSNGVAKQCDYTYLLENGSLSLV